MIDVKEVNTSNEKSSICNSILRALPNWFEMEEGIMGYVKEVESLPFFSAYDRGEAVGFVAMKIHSVFAAEVFVMGILNEYHRQGIGRKLIETSEKYCKEKKMEFLTVKTLDESRESNSYSKTRLFYQSVGFKKLETFPLLWDENNPCLFMAKHIT